MSTSAPSSRVKWSVILDYGIACVTPAWLLRWMLGSAGSGGIDRRPSVFLCGIMIVAWVVRPRPSPARHSADRLAFDYFLMQPVYSFALEFKEFTRLVLSPSRHCLWCR